ncbi:MAG: hypothetical protein U5P10_09125 [Spirochaetia bacterium]|nr:hypothetical protein [Spirochaetia bacterium]
MIDEENFDDIRPYRGNEVPEVLSRLKNSQWLMSGFGLSFSPKHPGFWHP